MNKWSLFNFYHINYRRDYVVKIILNSKETLYLEGFMVLRTTKKGVEKKKNWSSQVKREREKKRNRSFIILFRWMAPFPLLFFEASYFS